MHKRSNPLSILAWDEDQGMYLYRRATPAEVVAAVRELEGVEIVHWCESHRQKAFGVVQVCQWAQISDALNLMAGGHSSYAASCSIVSRLQIPLEVEQ